MKTKSLWLISIALIICCQLMRAGHYLTGIIVLAAVLLGLLLAWWYRPANSEYGRMLAYVVEDYQPEQARQLVAGMKPDTRAEFQKSTELLYLALQKGNMQGAELLLELGMDVNAFLSPAFSETSVLQTFCMDSEADMAAIRFLLEHGANPDAGLSFPPLLNAQAWGNEELVQLLLKHGANPNVMDPQANPSHNTPLHSLCSERNEDILVRVKALLAAGADVNALTSAGHTPLDVAMEQKGDEEKPMDATNGAMPLNESLIALLREHGALRGSQLRCPKPRFCGRVLIDGSLPDADLLRNLSQGEPGAKVAAVNHAWMGEGLGALVDDAAMDDAQKRAALAHTCYIEITLEEPGAVPMELGRRYLKLMSQVSKVSGCVGVDFGNTVIPPDLAGMLADNLQVAPFVLVQAKRHEEGMMTEGMEALGLLEVVYAENNAEKGVQVLMECILPMMLEYGTCLEHNHRAFITPDFSLVAKVEPLGPAGRPVLTLRPDYTNYRD